MRWHPDRNPGAEAAEKFKRASEAYAVLSNPDKRAAYDRLGHAAFRQAEAAGAKPGAGGPGFPGFGGFGGAGGGFEGEVDINDLLSEVFGDAFGGLFGGGRGERGPRRGRDVKAAVGISLEEAFAGAEHRLRLQIPVPCSTCDATGSKSKTPPAPCPACQGSGRRVERRGIFTAERPCPRVPGRELLDKGSLPCLPGRGARGGAARVGAAHPRRGGDRHAPAACGQG